MPPPLKRQHANVSADKPAVDIVDRVIERLHRDDAQMRSDVNVMAGSARAMASIMRYLQETLMQSGDDTDMSIHVHDLGQAFYELERAIAMHVRRPLLSYPAYGGP